jgi:hypothetical protein
MDMDVGQTYSSFVHDCSHTTNRAHATPARQGHDHTRSSAEPRGEQCPQSAVYSSLQGTALLLPSAQADNESTLRQCALFSVHQAAWTWGSAAVQAHLQAPCESEGQAGLFPAYALASPLTRANSMHHLTAFMGLQAELDNGESVKALRRFNRLLSNLPADSWGEGPSTETLALHGP